MNKLSLALISLMVLPGLSAAAFGQNQPSETHASAQLEGTHDHIHDGSDLTFTLTLKGPAPEGAIVNLVLGREGQPGQSIAIEGESLNKERTDFAFHKKLPVGVAPGEWHIAGVSIWSLGVNGTIDTNDVKFVIEGRQLEFPTKGTITLQPNGR